jgi:XTP/dITP diphosphohydrolase
MLTPNSELLVATKNKGKLREFAQLFEAQGIVVKSLHDYPELGDVEETGATFAENALLKARVIAARVGLPVLADDSGLCVSKLQDQPGIYSARYGGEHGNDARNNEKLLHELFNVTQGLTEQAEDGTSYLSAARFVCALAYQPQDGSPLIVEGECHGVIVPEPRGTGGFGYDPLFYLLEFGKTMAELTAFEKNQVSHRSRAIEALRDILSGNVPHHGTSRIL